MGAKLRQCLFNHTRVNLQGIELPRISQRVCEPSTNAARGSGSESGQTRVLCATRCNDHHQKSRSGERSGKVTKDWNVPSPETKAIKVELVWDPPALDLRSHERSGPSANSGGSAGRTFRLQSIGRTPAPQRGVRTCPTPLVINTFCIGDMQLFSLPGGYAP